MKKLLSITLALAMSALTCRITAAASQDETIDCSHAPILWMEQIIRAAVMDAGVGQSFDKHNPGAPFFKELVTSGLTPCAHYNLSNLQLILYATRHAPVAKNKKAAETRVELQTFATMLLYKQHDTAAKEQPPAGNIQIQAAEAWMKRIITNIGSSAYFNPLELFKSLITTGLLTQRCDTFNKHNLTYIYSILQSQQMQVAMAAGKAESTRNKMIKFVNELLKSYQ